MHLFRVLALLYLIYQPDTRFLTIEQKKKTEYVPTAAGSSHSKVQTVTSKYLSKIYIAFNFGLSADSPFPFV